MRPVRDKSALYNVRQAFVHWRRNEDDEINDAAAIDKLIETIDAALGLSDEEDADAWQQAVARIYGNVLAIYLMTNRVDLQDFAQGQSRFLEDRGMTA